MVKKGLVSIIIPTYNRPKELESTLKTIFNQSYREFETMIVDDGSSSDISHLGKKYPLKIIKQKHEGAAAARNNGFQHSKGEFLLFSDDDIIFKPNFLDRLVKALENNLEKSYAYCGFEIDGKVLGMEPFNADRLKKQNYISGISLIRRNRFPGWDPKIKRLQDWDLWLTMLKKEDYGILVPEILFSTSRVTSTISDDTGLKGWTNLQAYEVVKKKHALPDLTKPHLLLTSLYYSRGDLRKTFPEVDFGDYRRILIWAFNVVTRKASDPSYADLIKHEEFFHKAYSFAEPKIELENSLAWKLVMRYGKFNNKVFPPGTRRRNLVDTLALAFKIFLDEGFLDLTSHSYAYIKRRRKQLVQKEEKNSSQKKI